MTTTVRIQKEHVPEEISLGQDKNKGYIITFIAGALFAVHSL
ncbi:hypothetical protein [Paenibacillus alginolyticus]|nr:hypothetical protein [Paenibacillus frigoriresistens]